MHEAAVSAPAHKAGCVGREALDACSALAFQTPARRCRQVSKQRRVRCPVLQVLAGCRAAQSARVAGPPCRPSAWQTCGWPRLQAQGGRGGGGWGARAAVGRACMAGLRQKHAWACSGTNSGGWQKAVRWRPYKSSVGCGAAGARARVCASPASSMVSFRSVRLAGLSVVSHSCSGIISPNPCAAPSEEAAAGARDGDAKRGLLCCGSCIRLPIP